MELSTIAKAFVDLVRRHDWKVVQELPPEDVQILFDVVSAAEFEPLAVVPGRIRRHLRDQEGGKTADTYIVNNLCPYKVTRIVDESEHDHVVATHWLDSLLESARGTREVYESLVDTIASRIADAHPLDPIPLTEYGELLLEYPDESKHSRDHDALPAITLGVHAFCMGWVDRKRTTAALDVLHCRNCGLRVVFPHTTKTYGDLREYFALHVVHRL